MSGFHGFPSYPYLPTSSGSGGPYYLNDQQAQAMQNGKRQRRQAAALVVQSLWSSTNKKKTDKDSTAKNNGNKNNRPVLEVPPMGFGPIREPNGNDVLCGRGGLINGSPGNVQFRTIVSKKKKEYNSKNTKRHEKAHLAAEIVRHIRSMNPPGRFLREDVNGLWFDIGDARAIRKTGQALREAAPTIRQELEVGADGKKKGKQQQPPPKDDTDSGSDDGKTATTTTKKDKQSAQGERANSESPKRKKQEAENAKKETRAKKETAKKTSNTAAAEAKATVPSSDASVASNTTTKSKRSSWLPGRRSTNDTPVPADTTRSSQSFLIPTAALGPHITGSVTSVVPAGGMPRMSGGAVFSNSHRGGGVRASAPPVLAPEHHSFQHPTPHHHHHHFPYPYPQMHPMLHYPQMHPMHLPPVPMQTHPSAAYHNHPHPQQQQQQSPYHPMGYSEDAFGMNFFPTQDVTMEQQSEGSCTVSDISGLSSSVTGDQRKQRDKHNKMKHQPTSELEGVPPLLPPTSSNKRHENNSNNNNQARNAAPDDNSVAMIDTTSSLPSFSDILDDVDMASATSGKGSSLAMGSVTSSAVAKLMGPPTNNRNNHNSISSLKQQPLPPPQQQQQQQPPMINSNKNKRTQFANQPTMKENSNSTGSCLSGKSGLSGKSELSVPSSCGSNLSAFSDSFMALHLSDHHEFD
ncbi:Transcriptional regulator [Seminavis robusta]|uniref:Transcriptional regulator n=1 Tax=Seminavis robusta TaxID=568900 RepID=A0A9N8DK82_9STRA|nr:Transcriptional regulator [Seminavis robusta]|eukprot:Sro167_g074520.1 Transcriptional regulator (689) ;mRNA; r:61978-64212